ncbi:YigZ family protein [Streptococcus dysgalactiae]|uniref:Xaa-Pro dipeptidase n=2 Tax=Streptococcus TaxID=1301 RepID=A0AAE9R0B0_STREQ|nr:YigZ family protein [Streptococcus dysgalactiae]EGR89023.1 YigZ family protein [Streptococcus dysgalactiae subsp. equisimilis SK1250]MDY3824405.1 YigZ family protein [Streptococcus sp.]BAN94118.1 Xaa-Pro dipeptidase [Streptococcus dysgalactiae subsp. equisimilis 167]KKC21218.1 Xaa-Pro dipeptidase [Streptococcus dysgalactiae subsp. equisimilis]KKC23223.1 Xaa-Pro dipeptidase [Streptococcus dysgalactiae subsp. equisimilis]
MENYKTIKDNGLFEEEIKKSRFICQIKRITTEEEGKAFITAIKKEHYKANHSCSAMIIGDKSQIKRSSDDGEPSGTAGIPMLSVLEKQGLTNLVVVVTRYFGGIKLGTGGLIRAYSGVTAAAIKELGIVDVKKQAGLEVTLTYPQYQTYAQFLEQVALMETETLFSDTITTAIYFDPEREEEILAILTDYYHGKVQFTTIDPKIIEVPIMKE